MEIFARVKLVSLLSSTPLKYSRSGLWYRLLFDPGVNVDCIFF
jgi:hypothetical protein